LSATTAELAALGETFRRQRLQRGLEIADGAAALGIPTKSLRALEWGRRDLLDAQDAERIERRYAAFLGLEPAAPSPGARKVAPPRATKGSRSDWFLLVAALAPPLVIALPLALQEVPLLTLSLVLLSSLLLVGAALPPGIVARTAVSPATFARYREPLGMAAIGILIPVALFSVLAAAT
jgi:cytoskeletal protein RodZ